MNTDEIKPWHRQPGESRKAFHAFIHYRDLAANERSLNTAYSAHLINCQGGHGKHPNAINTPELLPGQKREATVNWKAWKVRFTWDARADAHDAIRDEAERLKKLAEIQAMNDRHAAISTAFQNQIVQQLTEATANGGKVKLSPGQMAIWLDKATTVERRARGQATDIVKHEGQDGTPLDLAQLTDEELELFQKLAQKAGVAIG